MPRMKRPQNRPRGSVVHYSMRRQLRTHYKDMNGEWCHIGSTIAREAHKGPVMATKSLSRM